MLLILLTRYYMFSVSSRPTCEYIKHYKVFNPPNGPFGSLEGPHGPCGGFSLLMNGTLIRSG